MEKIIRYSYCGGCGNWITAAAWDIMDEKEKKSFSIGAANGGLLIAEKPKSEWVKMDYGCVCDEKEKDL